MIDIKSFTLNEIENYIVSLNEPKYKARQIYKWLFSKKAESFDEMSDLSKGLRELLNSQCYISRLEVEKKQVSLLDNTVKFLYRLNDGNFVETVVMEYEHGNSVCVSTQVGCNMNCAFCASGIGGKIRNLSAGEITDQVIFSEKHTDKKINHIVLMGMGEPLDNYDNVINFINNANNPLGLNISQRNISLSTCGVVDKIYKLSENRFQITLSVSLHAADNETRSKIMPVNKKYNVNELINACRHYQKITNRRISFEYILIDGVNDGLEDAKKLCNLVKGIMCHINLIPFNNVCESGFKRPGKEKIELFYNYLQNRQINVTIRRELGKDIDASCGQLRKKALNGGGNLLCKCTEKQI